MMRGMQVPDEQGDNRQDDDWDYGENEESD